MKTVSESHACAGSAFFIILLGIAMFAALSYTMINGSRNSASMLTDDQARLAALEISGFADTLAKTIQAMRLRGCRAEEINFSHPNLSFTDNPNAPADKSCDVFDLNGGKINYLTPVSSWFETAHSTKYLYESWFFTSGTCVPGIGTGDGTGCDSDKAEILVILPWLAPEVCEALNKINLPAADGIPLAEEDSYYEGDEADGTFNGNWVLKAEGSDLFERQATGCFRGGTWNYGDDGYHFYHVLLAR